MSVDGEVTLRIRTRKVFVLRTWLGMAIMRAALWVMGADAESAL